MLNSVRLLVLMFLTSLAGFAAEGEWRKWTSVAGTVIEGRLLGQSDDSVTLERKDTGKPLTVKLDQLSQQDRDFIAELKPEPVAELPAGDTTIAGLEAIPGKVSGAITCAAGQWSYHLYLPKAFHTGRAWPVWMVMSAGGGGNGEPLRKYIDGAERLGCVLALSVESKNNFAESDVAMAAMADDVYKRLPLAPELGFSSGMSGGSRMAYLMAERDSRIAGVLACGSGKGVYIAEKDFRDSKLRRSTYVYSLIGTNCFNRNEAVRSHEAFPKDFRLRFFPGGHDWAGSPYIAEGMARVYGEGLKLAKDPSAGPLREAYSRSMSAWMDEMVGEQPWEAALWANFLAIFPGDPQVSRHAATVAAKLSADPRVQLARDAEREIGKFSKKHFSGDLSREARKKPDPSRVAEAAKLAAKYAGLPHAELITRLGGATG